MNIDNDFSLVGTNNFWGRAFKDFSEHSMDGLMVIDTGGRIMHANSAYCTLTGYSDNELLEMYVKDIEARLSQEQVFKHIELVIAAGRTRFETAHRKKDGSLIDVEVTISHIEVDREEFFVVVVRDLTEYKETINSVNAADAIKELSVKASSRREYFESVVKMIRNWSDCGSVGLRLVNNEGAAPFEAYVGFTNEFWSLENWISLNENCICTRVIKEHLSDNESPYITSLGSFYCNDLPAFAKCIQGCGKGEYRGTCLTCGFKSIAVIPVRYYKEVLGTIQLTDEKEGKMPLKLVKFIEKVAGYIGEAVYRYKMEEELRRNYDFLKVSDSIGRLSIEGASLTEVLNHALEQIFNIPWIPLKTCGCIFLTDEQSGDLVLKVLKNIKESNNHLCERIRFGECLCGKAAQSKKVVFSSSKDESHEIRYDNMNSHCQFCIPVVYSNRTVGVINVYLDEGYRHQRRDEEFLKRVADKLAPIIVRKQAERALKSSEKHLSLIHNSVSDLLFLVRVDPEDTFTVVTVNKSYLLKTGLKKKDVVGKRVEEIFPEPACSFAVRKFKEAISLGWPIEYQERIDLPKRQIVIDTTLTPIFNGSGECTHLLGVSHDVTERKQTEIALRESQERYRSLVKQSSDGVYIYDHVTKKIQEVNDQLLNMLGYTEEEITGLTAYDIIDRNREDVDSFVEKVLQEGQSKIGAGQYIRKDGTFLDVEVSLSLITYGYSQVITANVRDITERKIAEKKLRESFKQLRYALQETVNALTIIAEKRDPYTVGHQHRVSRLAVAIAEEMGLSRDIIGGINISGLLHDIGKVGVPIEILNKPGRLSDLEMAIIKNHPQWGFEIIQKIPFEGPVAQTVLQHQERYDGSGYPLGIAGEDILLEARIMAVADVVEAMASHRPYRPSLGMDLALGEITKKRGIHFDPQIVDACMKLFAFGFSWE